MICATETVLFTVTEITAKVRIFPAVIWLPSPPSTLLISGGGRRRSRLVRRGANDATSVGRRDKAPGDDVCAALTDSDRRPLVGGVDSVRVSGGEVRGKCLLFFLQTPAERCCVKIRRRLCIFFFFFFKAGLCVIYLQSRRHSRRERAPRQRNTPRRCHLEEPRRLLLLQERRAASAPLVCYSANRVSGAMDLPACPLQEE